jgi:hypothetical protein
MASPTASLSKTLKSITITKLASLEKERNAFSSRKRAILDDAEEASPDKRQKVSRLLEGVEELQLDNTYNKLWNMRRWLEQSGFDDSVSESMLDDFESQLKAYLDVQTRRLNLADLYSQLLKEWLGSGNEPQDLDVLMEESGSLDGNFELVQKDRLKMLREKFEAVVFNPLETDRIAIHDYLENLFDGDDGAKDLVLLRDQVEDLGEDYSGALGGSRPFNDRVLRWCLKGLLANELLSDEKKATLQDIQMDEVARAEICDVLNMKWADIQNWNWEAQDEGIAIEPRRQLNGKYRIMMDEDVLEAIFLHYIGIRWSVNMKSILLNLVKSGRVWKRNTSVPQEDLDRRHYYLGDKRFCQENGPKVELERQTFYQNDFCLSQLPTTEYEGAGGYDDDEVYDDDDFSRKSPKVIRQQLLRQLATELLLLRALDGAAAIVQSDFQWFGTALPHSTIVAVLRFVGVPEGWITFFTKFLEAPLNMGPVSDDPSAAHPVRIRKRGVPMAHALEKFFGELVLFFLDLTVNKEGGTLLYRFHDDLWICGAPEQCAKGWQRMVQFAEIVGLQFNPAKTGSVYLSSNPSTRNPEIVSLLPTGAVSVGFLTLDPLTGDWVIDQDEVSRHITQLQKQLSNCSSILSWVQTWNSCIGRFFSHTFGEPANCFGKQHVDSILSTYQRMQRILFNGQDGNGKTLVSHLKGLIASHFGITDIPDAFIFLPESLGGLGVRNPFISSFLVRDNVYEKPSKRLDDFFEDEKESYEEARKEFEARTSQERRALFRSIYMDKYGILNTPESEFESQKPLDAFMSFGEFTKFREAQSTSLCRAYHDLMRVPHNTHMVYSKEVQERLKYSGLAKADEEIKWLLQYYAKELEEKCGELTVVDRKLLPLGVLTILRKRKVSWQMAL